MKTIRTSTLIVSLLFAIISPMNAQDGAALYKGKCAGCHGANGEGKPAMKAPALRGASLDAGQVMARLTKGASGARPPHNKGMAGLKEDQAKAVADYVATMK